MSELITAIQTEVRQFMDSDREDIQRFLSRTAIIHAGNTEISVAQKKYLSPDDTRQLRGNTPDTFPTDEWFNDVELLQDFGETDQLADRLHLEARYPIDYFDEKPEMGTFVTIGGNEFWADQYGSVLGFRSEGKIAFWTPSFVASGSSEVTRLRYPDDPTALEQYNARYLEYLQTLNESSPVVSYYRGWGQFNRRGGKPQLVLGGLSLTGFGVNDIIVEGDSPVQDQQNMTRIILNYKSERENGYVGRDIVISDGKQAVTQPFWDGEDDIQPAGEELLTTTLELIQKSI